MNNIEESAGTPNKFIVLRQEVLYDDNLTMSEKFVYARMCQFDEYYESCKEAGAILGLSPETVKKAKQKLVKLGYAEELVDTGRGKVYKIYPSDEEEIPTRRVKSTRQTGKKVYIRRVKSTRRVIELNKKENKDTKVSLGESELSPVESSAREEYGREDINRMFDEWERAFSYRPKDSRANRYAASNMLRNKQIGYQRLSGIIKALPALQAKKFCLGKVKGVSDFASLQREWDAVWAMALREYNNQQQHKFTMEDLKV